MDKIFMPVNVGNVSSHQLLILQVNATMFTKKIRDK